MTRSAALIGLLALTMSCNSANSTPSDGGSEGTLVAKGPTSAPAAEKGANEVVATAEGITVTSAEVEEAIAGQRYEVDEKLYQLRRGGAYQVLIEKLIQKEAGKKVDAETYIRSKAAPVTDTDIQEFYDSNRIRLGGRPLDDTLKGQLRNYLGGQREQEYVGKLLETAKAEVLYNPPDPPRVEVGADDDPFKGPKDAQVTIIEFSDFQCPACRSAAQMLPGILSEFDGKVKVVYRDFPLMSKHPQALKAAVAAECAADQGKFWEMHDTLFANTRALAPTDLQNYAKEIGLDMKKYEKCMADPAGAAEVQADMADGRRIGVNATPTFIVNGMMVSGANEQKLKYLIRKELGLDTKS